MITGSLLSVAFLLLLYLVVLRKWMEDCNQILAELAAHLTGIQVFDIRRFELFHVQFIWFYFWFSSVVGWGLVLIFIEDFENVRPQLLVLFEAFLEAVIHVAEVTLLQQEFSVVLRNIAIVRLGFHGLLLKCSLLVHYNLCILIKIKFCAEFLYF